MQGHGSSWLARLAGRVCCITDPKKQILGPQNHKVAGTGRLGRAPHSINFASRERTMIKHAFSSAAHTNLRPARKPAAGVLLSTLSLAGLLLLGGCNKAPAPAADTAQSTPPAAPAPAAPAPAAPAPAARSPRPGCSSRSCCCPTAGSGHGDDSGAPARPQADHCAFGNPDGGPHGANRQCER